MPPRGGLPAIHSIPVRIDASADRVGSTAGETIISFGPTSLVGACLCVALSAWSLPVASASGRGDLAPLLAEVERIRIERGVAGVSLAIVSADAVLYEGGLGVADLRDSRLVTKDTIFRIGSLTKFFTAAVLLQLQESGRLRLTDPVRVHVPDADFANPWESDRPVTVEQLLEHSAGLPDLTKAEIEFDDPKPMTLKDALAWRRSERTLRWKPGLHMSYSNAGYCLAGQVIERVLGARYEDAVRSRLLEPLGMTSTGFFPTEADASALAVGYEADGRTPRPWWHMIMRPFGGLHSTAHDMTAVLRMLLDGGRSGERRILTPGSILRAELPATTLAARSGLRFGYGLGLHGYFHEGHLFHGHSGDANGYLAHFGYDRALGLGFFVAINRDDWSALVALRRAVESWMTKGLPDVEPPARARVPEPTLAGWAGRYEPATGRYDVRSIRERADAIARVEYSSGYLLTVTGDGTRQPLVPVDATRFRREEDPVATSIFVRDEDGSVYFEEGESYVRTGDL